MHVVWSFSLAGVLGSLLRISEPFFRAFCKTQGSKLLFPAANAVRVRSAGGRIALMIDFCLMVDVGARLFHRAAGNSSLPPRLP